MTSLWAERTPRPDGIAKTLDGDVSVDVLVIGGGDTGNDCQGTALRQAALIWWLWK